jgi:hypothetical protein
LWVLLGILIGLLLSRTALGQTILDLLYTLFNALRGAARGTGEPVDPN